MDPPSTILRELESPGGARAALPTMHLSLGTMALRVRSVRWCEATDRTVISIGRGPAPQVPIGYRPSFRTKIQ
jgi:hypothetical protein